jgi:hypothetical protein
MALLKHTDPRNGSISWTGEDPDDLMAWLSQLTDCPTVTQPVVLRCEKHERDPVFCGYVQADPHTGVARRRCVACAEVTDLFDSGERWSYPETFECQGCRSSLVELAVGINAEPDGQAHWLALAARCIGCGRISGLTDVTINALTVDEVLASV